MAYLVTMIRRRDRHPDGDAVSSFEVVGEIEAARIAQEGAMIANRQGAHVTYEVHDAGGQLILFYTSASADA